MKRPGFKSFLSAIFMALFISSGISAPCRAELPSGVEDSRMLYDCQNKAAEYTYNLDRAGEKELFDSHVTSCMEVARNQRMEKAREASKALLKAPAAAAGAMLAGPRLNAPADDQCSTECPDISCLKPGDKNDLEIRGKAYCVTEGKKYTYRYINILDGGTLRFLDTNTAPVHFWAKSILVENNGTLEIGTDKAPIKNRTVTIHLYGSDKNMTDPPENAITCTKPGCGLAADQDKYSALITDDQDGKDPAAYFGRKVIAVSNGGSLRMFGGKGVLGQQSASGYDSSGISWARLNGSITEGAKKITLDRMVAHDPPESGDWKVGDDIVISATDYLPGHAEKFTITSIETTMVDSVVKYSTLGLSDPVKFPHNGERYKLKDRISDSSLRDSILSRKEGDTTITREYAETRAAVALLSRNIKIVSEGTKPDESLPDPVCDSSNLGSCDTNRYFGGHVIARQGFKQFQMQGVELYQMGQGGRMAHVPVNFFLTRRVPDGTFVKDSSIWDSMNHWIELRGAQNVTLQRNVGYKSIGHGFVLADGTETDNNLIGNIGIYARPGADYRDNPRKVPGVLSRRTLDANVVFGISNNEKGDFQGYIWNPTTTSLATTLSLGGDLFNPSPFFIMNAYNDFTDNMATGAGACGSCYWFAPARISAFSRNIGNWTGMAGVQDKTSGAAPIKSFKGNFCSTAMHSLLTVGSVGTCNGFAKHPGDGRVFEDPAMPAIPNPLAESYYTKGCNENYWKQKDIKITEADYDKLYKSIVNKDGNVVFGEKTGSILKDFIKNNKEFCPGVIKKSDGSIDVDPQHMIPNISEGAFLQAQTDSGATCMKDDPKGCGVNVIDSYTSSFHWAETNFSAIWLRTFWFLFTDSFLSDVQNGGLTMVSGGSYDQVPEGYWGLTRRSVFVGATQKNNKFATASGPEIYNAVPNGKFAPDNTNKRETLYCSGTPAAYCLLKHKKCSSDATIETCNPYDKELKFGFRLQCDDSKYPSYCRKYDHIDPYYFKCDSENSNKCVRCDDTGTCAPCGDKENISDAIVVNQTCIIKNGAGAFQSCDRDGTCTDSGKNDWDKDLVKANGIVSDDYEGVSFQTSNLSGFQRLINIYDGPVYLDSVAFLDIKKTNLTDNTAHPRNNACSSPKKTDNGVKQCNNTPYIWSDNRLFPVPVDKDDPNYIPYGAQGFETNKNQCILPNAAIGWKQPNGFYYPPAFHMQKLYFDNVDIRHFVLVPPFTPGTMTTDSARLSTDYCAYTPDTFASFTDIDRQTQINDDDGSLSGITAIPKDDYKDVLRFTGSISLNNDTFYHTPNRMFECQSQQSCLQTPYDHLNLAVIPSGSTYDKDKNIVPVTPDSGVNDENGLDNLQRNSVWDKECQNQTCGGSRIYRQLLLDGETSGEGQAIRMMGAGISQRSVMLANNGIYYVDTLLKEENKDLRKTIFASGKDGLKYNFFLLFAKPTSKITLQLYVGSKKPDVTRIRVDTKKIGGSKPFMSSPADPQIDAIKIVTGETWPEKDITFDKGILTITMDLTGDTFKGDFNDSQQKSCQPGGFCEWSEVGKTCKSKNNNKDYDEICRYWALRTPECPSGGCYGFQIRFPDDFVASNDNKRPPAAKYSDSAHTGSWPDTFELTPAGLSDAKFAYVSDGGDRLDVSYSNKNDGQKTTLYAQVKFKGDTTELIQLPNPTSGSDTSFADSTQKIYLELSKNGAKFGPKSEPAFKGTMVKPLLSTK